MESLENRRVLTDIAWSYGNEFTVRRDEAQPIELDIYHTYHSGRTVAPVEVIEPGNSTVTIQNGTVHYQPDSGFVGVDFLTLRVSDTTPPYGRDPINEEVRVAVNVIEPLFAVDDWYFAVAGAEPMVLDVLSNDISNGRYATGFATTDYRQQERQDPSLTIQSFYAEGSGTVEVDATGDNLIYAPAEDFTGVESIRYTAVDADGYTTDGIVRVRVAHEVRERLWPEQLQTQLIERAVHAGYFGLSGLNDVSITYNEKFSLCNSGPIGPTLLNDVFTSESSTDRWQGTDRVKTDGEFLYFLSNPAENGGIGSDLVSELGFFPDGSGDLPADISPFIRILSGDQCGAIDSGEKLLTIVDIRDPARPKTVSRHALTDHALSIDLHNDRLTVITARGRDTAVTILDVSDRTSIRTVSTTVIDGVFERSQRIGETLFVFTERYSTISPRIERLEFEDGAFSFYETAKEYLERVSDSLMLTAFPHQDVLDGAGNFVSSDLLGVDALDAGVPSPKSLSITTFDTSRDIGGSLDWQISDGYGRVLVTENSIYVTSTIKTVFPNDDWAWDVELSDSIPSLPRYITEIERYTFDDHGTVSLSATGTVPGILRDDFSIDEHDGLLRIATENSWPLGARPKGWSVYVLEQSDSQLNTIGVLTGIAEGQRVNSFRFAGNRGFLMLAQPTDPILAIDLSDPRELRTIGTVETPGFAHHLQPFGESHMVGIGRNANETGDSQDLAVWFINVSDLENPVLEDDYLFGGGSETQTPFAGIGISELADPHALSFFDNLNFLDAAILAIPYDGGDLHPGVRTLQIDSENGISIIDDFGFGSQPERTVRVGEHLYAMSPDQLLVTHLTEPDGVVANLELLPRGVDQVIEATVGDNILIELEHESGANQDIVEVLGASLVEGTGELEIVNERQIRFHLGNENLSRRRVHYSARDASGALIDAIIEIDPDLQWQNEVSPFDVNQDGKTSPSDALSVINLVAEHGFKTTEELEDLIQIGVPVEHSLIDTNGDNAVSPADALAVINWMEEARFRRAEAVAGVLSESVEKTREVPNDSGDSEQPLPIADFLDRETRTDGEARTQSDKEQTIVSAETPSKLRFNCIDQIRTVASDDNIDSVPKAQTDIESADAHAPSQIQPCDLKPQWN